MSDVSLILLEGMQCGACGKGWLELGGSWLSLKIRTKRSEESNLTHYCRLNEHRGPVYCLLPLEDIGRDGMLASGSADSSIKIWQPWSVGYNRKSVATVKQVKRTT